MLYVYARKHAFIIKHQGAILLSRSSACQRVYVVRLFLISIDVYYHYWMHRPLEDSFPCWSCSRLLVAYKYREKLSYENHSASVHLVFLLHVVVVYCYGSVSTRDTPRVACVYLG
jgi:hypothetical protein